MRLDNMEIAPDQLITDANNYENSSDAAHAKVDAYFAKLEKSIGQNGTDWRGTLADEESDKIKARHEIIKTGNKNVKTLAQAIRNQANSWREFDEK